ncbi:hypothetical protein F5Y16DRAFT_417280 [Xylariaceae sp. FL0255]|nr:hypothetical protein F5Y16DRAFT_417280 [Xylariaceae sp. FL0255]
MNDFRHMADDFVSYQNETWKPCVPYVPSGSLTTKGLRVSCLGDGVMLGKPYIEEVLVPLEGGVAFGFGNELNCVDNSTIATLIGIPTIAYRCFPHPKWANTRDWEAFGNQSPYKNPEIENLHLCCNIESPYEACSCAWAELPAGWKRKTGSVLIYRRDKKPLLKEHLIALFDFCSSVKDLLARSKGDRYPAPGSPWLSKFEVQYMISPASFTNFWSIFCDEKRKQGSVVDVVSPYEV